MTNKSSSKKNEALITPEFWRNRRVFITGHTGFKGSWLSLWLHHLGAQVCGFALAPPTTPALFNILGLEQKIQSITGDVRDLAALTAAMQSFQPEIVIHMAAQSLVRLSYETPVETYATNVMGSVHLLEAVRCVKSVKAVINVTSDKCYANQEWPWGYREYEPKGGYDPYSNSKGCAELVTEAYRNSFFNIKEYDRHGCAVASARAGNVIGGGDWAADRLVPDILNAFNAQEILEIRSPHAIRPWQHVLEPLSGYLLLAQKLVEQGPVFAEGWNFGPFDESAQPVATIVQIMADRWNQKFDTHSAQWRLPGDQTEKKPQPHEAIYLKLDCSKARQSLHWQPRWSLQQTLDQIIHWHQQWLLGNNMTDVSLMQIQEYSEGNHYATK